MKNIISACRECKVKRLIYNSTADVVLDTSHDIHNGNETLLYATKVCLLKILPYFDFLRDCTFIPLPKLMIKCNVLFRKKRNAAHHLMLITFLKYKSKIGFFSIYVLST